MNFKAKLKLIPGLGLVVGKLARWLLSIRFPGSARYWDEVYASGGNSGEGSYGRLARFKAEVVNKFVAEELVASVVEFGCGDGHQLSLASYPSYLGVDVSSSAVALCRARFEGDERRRFLVLDQYNAERAQLALSLDVIYHLVEDQVYESYMDRLFEAATHFVIIYSTNYDGKDVDGKPHVRHRRFSEWVDRNRADFALVQVLENRYPDSDGAEHGSPAQFYFYKRCSDRA